MKFGMDYSEKKCHRCGKEIIVHSVRDWVFKRNIKGEKFFCSWSCLRDWEENRGSKIDRREKIKKALIEGMSVNEICDKYDVDKTNVLYWKRRVVPRDSDEVEVYGGEADGT